MDSTPATGTPGLKEAGYNNGSGGLAGFDPGDRNARLQ
jgi:hypothetical protein